MGSYKYVADYIRMQALYEGFFIQTPVFRRTQLAEAHLTDQLATVLEAADLRTD